MRRWLYILLVVMLWGALADVSAVPRKRKKKRARRKFRKQRTWYRYAAPYIDTTLYRVKAMNLDSFRQVPTLRDTLLEICKTYMGIRYRYGGTDPRGFDCSGYVRYCFNRIGVNLPHHSGAQMQLGSIVNEVEALPGDIIYFGYRGRRRKQANITHSGIVYSNENGKVFFIHSASRVGIRIDCLDQAWYRRRFMGIRRVLP